MCDGKTFCLVYASSASKHLSDAELENILKTSRANNARFGITGTLLYAGGNFLQILEGDKTQVETLYQAITKDHRHHGALRILTRFIEGRSFADWSMGYQRLEPETLDHALPGFNRFLEDRKIPQEAYQQVSKSVWSLLTSFRQVVNV